MRAVPRVVLSVSVLSDVVCRVLSLRECGVLGAVLLAVHQLCLSRLGLSEFILYAPRASWLEQNREGVASVIGYLALYLLALQLAEVVMRQTGKVSHTAPPAAQQLLVQPVLLGCAVSDSRLVLLMCGSLRVVVSVVDPATQERYLLCQSTSGHQITQPLLPPILIRSHRLQQRPCCDPLRSRFVLAVRWFWLAGGPAQCFVLSFALLHAACSKWVQPASRRLVSSIAPLPPLHSLHSVSPAGLPALPCTTSASRIRLDDLLPTAVSHPLLVRCALCMCLPVRLCVRAARCVLSAAELLVRAVAAVVERLGAAVLHGGAVAVPVG